MRILLLAVGLALTGAAPAAAAGVFFQTPSRNIGCAYFNGSLRCDVRSGLRPVPRGRCELDWTGISLGSTGRARPTCAGDTAYDARSRILAYGSRWRRGGITCTSRRTGLIGQNRSRHGFVLARERWRVF
jgi:hypothetical protein